jgi:alpha-glucosidase
MYRKIFQKDLFVCLLLSATIVCTYTVTVFADSSVVQSPDRKLTLTVVSEPELSYSVQYEGKEIVAPSKLGVQFKDESPFVSFSFVTKSRAIDNKWMYPWGRQVNYADNCNEVLITLTETSAPNRVLKLQARAYNDGVAFRYLIDEKTVSKKEYVLEQDLTEFNFSGNPTAWFTTYDKPNGYQEEYFFKNPLRSIAADKVMGCPVVVQISEGPYVAITEADGKTWGGLFFKAGNSDDNVTRLKSFVSPRVDGNGLAKSVTPDASPWRVFIVASKAINLVDQTIIMNISTPAESYAPFAWIKPGRAAWDWWSDGNKNMSTDSIKKYIDFAASQGWEYSFIDAPWYTKPNVLKGNDKVNMDEVVQYAKEKKVRLFLWLHSNEIKTEHQKDEAFRLYEKWGIAGLKIDFMNREDQEMIEWYDKTVKKAAQHKLLIDFHGAFKPNGYRRSQPNLITREAIRGNEYNKWSRLTPEHYCTLPYTRLILGPADFTPGAFLNRHFDDPDIKGYSTAQGVGTRAHELAISLLYDSPILCLCDCPEVMLKEDAGCLAFYRDLPTVWDESYGVEGEIGEYFSLLRRKGNNWYYGAITNKDARTLSLPLTFLGEGQFEATIYADTPETDKDARKINIETKTVSASDTMEIKLSREGGQTIVFKKTASQ